VLTIVYQLLQQLLNLYWWVVIIAAVMSNLIAFGVLDTRNRIVWTVTDFLYRLTEPALRRIRNILPSFGGLDLSPIVLLLIIWVLQRVLERVYTAIVFGGLQPLFY
jgi:YggT family protein